MPPRSPYDDLARDAAAGGPPIGPRTLGVVNRFLPLALDLVLIVVFATIGRRTHAEGLTLEGIAGTAWPFLVACVLGWLGARVWRDPLQWRRAIWLWLVTVVGGMVGRRLTGDTTELPFVIVATLTLAVFLLGWRLVARLVRRRQTANAD